MLAAALVPAVRAPLRFVAVVFASSFSSSASGSGVFSFPSSVVPEAADAPDAPRVRGASDVGTGVRLVRVALPTWSAGADGSGGTGGTASSVSSCFTAALPRAPRRPFEVVVGGRESSGSSLSAPSATSIGFARVPRRVVLGARLAVVVVDAPPAGVGVFARVRRAGLASASSVLPADVADESVAVRVRRVERVK